MIRLVGLAEYQGHLHARLVDESENGQVRGAAYRALGLIAAAVGRADGDEGDEEEGEEEDDTSSDEDDDATESGDDAGEAGTEARPAEIPSRVSVCASLALVTP